MVEGDEAQLQAFLTSAVDGGNWSASWPGRFNPVGQSRGQAVK
jgi:hypothetical protein